MTVHNVAGSPANNPNKTLYSKLTTNTESNWSSEALNSLSSIIKNEIVEKDEFDKLDNPFLNGLKKFCKANMAYCKKCEVMTKMIINGVAKNTFQFDCKKGLHHMSATQILSTIPDEEIMNLAEMMEDSTRIQTMKWLDKEHLCEEIWETKGLKNATKRFAIDLSPLKANDTKVRAVNSSLEKEVNELRQVVERLLERQESIEAENASLRKALNAAKEEADMLRRVLAEESPKCKLSNQSFAEVASIHRPELPKRPKPIRDFTPIETISKPTRMHHMDRPAFSPLKIVFFEGCHRKGPEIYRKMFKNLGIDTRTIRDITFLADDLMQLTTYESAIDGITAALQGISEKVRRLDSFDPTQAESYSKYGKFSDEEVKAGYFAIIAKSAERLKNAAGNVKALRRSANFLNKVVENQSVDYRPQEVKPRIYFLGNLLNYTKPTTSAKVDESKDEDMESGEMAGVEQSAPSI